jgi:protein-S-isoprenylcysteine O-methyltransferase Ste14
MEETFYKLSLLILMIVFLAVRAPYVRRYRMTEKKVMKSTTTDLILIGLSTLGMMVFPLIYIFSSFFNGFMIHLPDAIRIAGLLVYMASIVLMYLVLRELGRDWSMKLELGVGHRLVTSGPYSQVRHPMYTAFYLMMIGQLLLTSNWFVGIYGVAIWTLFCIIRIPEEERMMTEEFGDDYIIYREKTGNLLPRLN